jgi:hypothetical protein
MANRDREQNRDKRDDEQQRNDDAWQDDGGTRTQQMGSHRPSEHGSPPSKQPRKKK